MLFQKFTCIVSCVLFMHIKKRMASVMDNLKKYEVAYKVSKWRCMPGHETGHGAAVLSQNYF